VPTWETCTRPRPSVSRNQEVGRHRPARADDGSIEQGRDASGHEQCEQEQRNPGEHGSVGDKGVEVEADAARHEVDGDQEAEPDGLELHPQLGVAHGGVPIEGEAGVGYSLAKGYELPPMTFSERELEALVLGMRIVGAWSDDDLAASAKDALRRIEDVLPTALRKRLSKVSLFAPSFHVPKQVTGYLGRLRGPVEERRKVALDYTRKDGVESGRVVRPLGLFYWGSTWSLAAWCELRQDFRSFRLDRMRGVTVLAETFDDENARGLDAFMRKVAAEMPPKEEGPEKK